MNFLLEDVLILKSVILTIIFVYLKAQESQNETIREMLERQDQRMARIEEIVRRHEEGDTRQREFTDFLFFKIFPLI